MTVEKINETIYESIYCLYDKAGKPLGTKEVVLAGRNAGTHYYSLTSKSREEVENLFRLAGKQTK